MYQPFAQTGSAGGYPRSPPFGGYPPLAPPPPVYAQPPYPHHAAAPAQPRYPNHATAPAQPPYPTHAAAAPPPCAEPLSPVSMQHAWAQGFFPQHADHAVYQPTSLK